MAEEKEKPVDAAIDKVSSGIGVVEKAGCACLNIGCLLLVICVLSIIAMLVNVVTNPLEALSSLLSGIWDALKGD